MQILKSVCTFVIICIYIILKAPYIDRLVICTKNISIFFTKFWGTHIIGILSHIEKIKVRATLLSHRRQVGLCVTHSRYSSGSDSPKHNYYYILCTNIFTFCLWCLVTFLRLNYITSDLASFSIFFQSKTQYNVYEKRLKYYFEIQIPGPYITFRISQSLSFGSLTAKSAFKKKKTNDVSFPVLQSSQTVILKGETKVGHGIQPYEMMSMLDLWIVE